MDSKGFAASKGGRLGDLHRARNAAHEFLWVLVFGLMLSIALMAVAANYIARLLERHHWNAYIGLVIVAYVAADMIYRGLVEVTPPRPKSETESARRRGKIAMSGTSSGPDSLSTVHCDSIADSLEASTGKNWIKEGTAMIARNLLGNWLLLAAVAMAMAVAPTATFAAKDVIKLHEGDFTGALVDGKLAQIILEDEMDYKVKRIFLPFGPAVYEAIVAGDLDAGFEFWPSYTPEKERYITKFGGDGSVDYIGDMGVIGASGWYVPRYVVEGDAERGIAAVAPDLKTYEQLDQYKDIFAVIETKPKGRLLAAPVAAWQSMDAERVEGLGLDYQAVVLGSEMAHWGELEAAYARGEPILMYAWEPHWVHAKYDLVEIGLPEHSDEGWPATDWPNDVTFKFGSPTLKDRYADVHQLLSNVRLTNAQQAVMILDVDVNGMDLEAAVRKWMAANEAIWRAWLPAAM